MGPVATLMTPACGVASAAVPDTPSATAAASTVRTRIRFMSWTLAPRRGHEHGRCAQASLPYVRKSVGRACDVRLEPEREVDLGAPASDRRAEPALDLGDPVGQRAPADPEERRRTGGVAGLAVGAQRLAETLAACAVPERSERARDELL